MAYDIPWAEKYKPKDEKSLATHSSKTKFVKDWLLRVTGKVDFDISHGDKRIPVLALCGQSGCCKSTLVEVLCQQNNIQILEWSNDNWESDATSRYNPLSHYRGTFGSSSRIDSFPSSSGSSKYEEELFSSSGQMSRF